jgi:hypothetical protein
MGRAKITDPEIAAGLSAIVWLGRFFGGGNRQEREAIYDEFDRLEHNARPPVESWTVSYGNGGASYSYSEKDAIATAHDLAGKGYQIKAIIRERGDQTDILKFDGRQMIEPPKKKWYQD